MKLITNGDFLFPFNLKIYLQEQFYLWSYSTGVPNLDEIMRFFIRIPNLIIFMVFGSNIAVSYFYILLVALVCFFSFKYFCNYFLKINSNFAVIMICFFYTFNPIFLGNYAKIGLILATTMAPLLLTFTKRYFETERFKYLLCIIFALNISFIHPFILAVNFLILGVYFLTQALKSGRLIRRNLVQFSLAIVIFLLFNIYIIVSVLSIGSLNKSTLSQNLSSQNVDSANLVNLANTENLLTAFSLSKNVFLDFRFFNPTYKNIYFISAYTILGVFVGLFTYSYYRLNQKYKNYLIIWLGIVLSLLLLTTGSQMGVDKLLKLLTNLPGGWAFRSPLKWQLYIPLFFCAIFVVVLQILKGRLKKGILAILAITILAINGYVSYEVYIKLLLPDETNNLVTLQRDKKKKFDSRVLLVKDGICNDYFRKEPSLYLVLKESYASHFVQLKEIDEGDIKKINLSNYNSILSCNKLDDIPGGFFSEDTSLKTIQGELFTYKNNNPKNKVYITNLIAIPESIANFPPLAIKTPDKAGNRYDFIDDGIDAQSSAHITELFEDMDLNNLRNGELAFTLEKVDNLQDGIDLQLSDLDKSSFYKFSEEGKLNIYGHSVEGAIKFDRPILLNATLKKNSLDINYQDTNYNLSNLLDNSSMEDGLWKKEVEDCFNYDNNPEIDMKLNSSDKTDGKHSLQLTAASHMACTSPTPVQVEENESYLIYFDYKTNKDAPSRYNLLFSGDNAGSHSEKLEETGGIWKSYSNFIEAPKGADKLKLTVYGVPSVKKGKTDTLYDNFQITKVPKISSRFFLTKENTQMQANKATVQYAIINPTKIKVDIKEANGILNLALNDSYHKGWQLLNRTDTVLPFGIKTVAAKHIKINRQENAWQINIEQYCFNNPVCKKNQNGTYDIPLNIEFMPQKWLILSLIISTTTLIGCIAYLGYDWRKGKRSGFRGKDIGNGQKHPTVSHPKRLQF